MSEAKKDRTSDATHVPDGSEYRRGLRDGRKVGILDAAHAIDTLRDQYISEERRDTLEGAATIVRGLVTNSATEVDAWPRCVFSDCTMPHAEGAMLCTWHVPLATRLAENAAWEAEHADVSRRGAGGRDDAPAVADVGGAAGPGAGPHSAGADDASGDAGGARVGGSDPVATFDAWAKGRTFAEPERTTSATAPFKAGDRVRVIGGAWTGNIGNLASVTKCDERVVTVRLDGEPGTLSTATEHVELCASDAPPQTAYERQVAFCEAIGAEPCEACGCVLNEHRDYVIECLELRKKVAGRSTDYAPGEREALLLVAKTSRIFAGCDGSCVTCAQAGEPCGRRRLTTALRDLDATQKRGDDHG